MAVTEMKTYRFTWRPSEEALWSLSAEDRRAAEALSPRAWVREVAIEAIGDDFVQLCGEWFDGPWLATCLKDARRAWVFLTDAGAGLPLSAPLRPLAEEAAYFAAERLAGAAPCASGERAYAVAPGGTPGWPKTDRPKLLRLLEGASPSSPESALAGLLFTAARPAHACGGCGGRGDGNCGSCGGHCHATNGNA